MEGYKDQPIGIDIIDFKKLREEGYFYADKTEYMWKLMERSGVKFLTRPRRFGKSMFLSALYYLFRGERALFDGLAISWKDYDWKKYPVIHLDFSSCDTNYYHTGEKLNQYIADKIRSFAKDYGVTLQDSPNGAYLFENLIVSLYEKFGPVVILIDEYDKPVTDHFYSSDAGGLILTLKSFYSVIKACDRYERFVFVTGVTRIALTTFFSSFNNPQDISMNADYAGILGYTQTELERYFGERMGAVAEKYGIPVQDMYAAVKHWYNGYCFCENTATVYNPVSIGYFFLNGGKFSNFWIRTGTPAVVLETARRNEFNIVDALNSEYSESVFNAFDLNEISPVGLLLQTGYLTIRSARMEGFITRYSLGYPNYEVSSSFNEYLLKIWANMPVEMPGMILEQMKEGILKENLQLIQSAWTKVFSHFIYDLRNQIELAYETVFYVFSLIASPGETEAEKHTNSGRADSVIETDKAAYIFEFKVDVPSGSHAALRQISERDYGARYRLDGKHVYAIGIHFSRETGNITEYESVPYGQWPWMV